MATNGIGASVRRKDQRFITGTGHFTDDIDRPGQVYAYFVLAACARPDPRHRPEPRRGGARRARGVRPATTSRRPTGRPDLRLDGQVQGRLGHESRAPSDPRARARSATSATTSPAWSLRPTIRRAMRPSWSRSTTRAAGLRRDRTRPRSAGAAGPRRDRTQHRLRVGARRRRGGSGNRRRGAHHQVDLVNNRLVPNAIEPRRDRRIRSRHPGHALYHQPEPARRAPLVISAFIGVAPEHKLRVIAPDVGGGFGSKIFIYAEECVVCWRRRGSAGR